MSLNSSDRTAAIMLTQANLGLANDLRVPLAFLKEMKDNPGHWAHNPGDDKAFEALGNAVMAMALAGNLMAEYLTRFENVDPKNVMEGIECEKR